MQRFVDSGQLTERELGEIYWDRSTTKWLMGRFDEAAADAEVAVRIAEALNEAPAILENKRKSLRLMREHRCHLDMLD